MSRWKAAGIHLFISLLLAAIVATLLYTLWFPPPYFEAAGANELIPLLMGVDMALGPLLTLVAISPGKSRKLRRLDLTVIATLQAVAFGYGFFVMCQARPVFIVVESDRMVLVAADDLSDADLAKGHRPEFRRRSWTGPQLVGALPPTGKRGGDLALQVLGGGKDIDRLPEFYVPLDEVTGKLMKRAKPLKDLKLTAEQQKKLVAIQKTAASGAESLYFVPFERPPQDYAAIVTTAKIKPLAIVHADPWIEMPKK